MSSPLKFIFSGGGTGGHIFPAIAIANAVKEIRPDAEILFIGAEGRMEMEKVPAAGYRIEGLWISGFQRKQLWKNISLPFKMISSLTKARRLVKDFKPNVVIGTGGFASGPTLRAAAGMGVPTLIQEQNSFPGITNKMLAGKAKKICVAFKGMERFFSKEKLVLTGNPVRKDILDIQSKRPEALNYFKLDASRKTLLVIGGSLGARTINESILFSMRELETAGIQVIWQTGKSMGTEAIDKVRSSGLKHIHPSVFIDRMDLAYAAADLVVSRAGAISVSEICVAGKAVILVPSPNVAEDHQTKNAMALVKEGGAVLIRDSEAVQKLGEEIISLFIDDAKRNGLASQAKKLSLPDAAVTIAQQVIELAQRK